MPTMIKTIIVEAPNRLSVQVAGLRRRAPKVLLLTLALTITSVWIAAVFWAGFKLLSHILSWLLLNA